MTQSMYQEQLLDQARRPRNFGVLEQPTHQARVTNPLCGDEIDMYAIVTDDVLTKIQFTGRGCTIAMAAASLLTQHLQGKTIAEALAITNEQAIALLGVPIVPARLKCATLSLEAVQQTLGHHA